MDLYGDPLPRGAFARLGTTRLNGFCEVERPVFSPRGDVIATTGNGAICLWSTESGRQIRRLGEGGKTDREYCFSFTPDGAGIMAADGDGKKISRWNVHSGAEEYSFDGPGYPIGSLALSPDSKLLAVRGLFNQLNIYDLAARRRSLQIGGDEPKAAGVVVVFTAGKPILFSRDGRMITVLESARQLVRFDSRTGKQTEIVEIEAGWLKLALDGGRIAIATSRGIRVTDLDSKKSRDLSGSAKQDWEYLKFSPDGKTILGCKSRSDLVALWDADSGRELRRLRVTGLDLVREKGDPAFSNDGKWMVVPEGSFFLRLWDLTTGRPVHAGPLLSPTELPSRLQFVAGRKEILSISGNCLLRWDLTTQVPVQQVYIPQRFPAARWIEFGQSGNLSASQDEENRDIILYDLRANKELRRISRSKQSEEPIPLAFSNDERLLAGVEDRDTVRVWDVRTGKESLVLRVPDDAPWISWLKFSPEGSILAVGGRSDPWRVDCWDLKSGKWLPPIVCARDERSDASTYTSTNDWSCWFTPDARMLYTSCGGVYLIAWDLVAGRAVRMFGGEKLISRNGLPYGQSPLSPDGRILVCKDADGDLSLGLWETVSGKKICAIPGKHWYATFSHDGKMLASPDFTNCSILLWDVRSVILGSTDREPLLTWKELAAEDPGVALRTVLKLATDEKAALALLRPYLRPVLKTDPKEIAARVNDLDSSSYPDREKASARLRELGEAVEPDLRAAAANGSLEVRTRAAALLEALHATTAARIREVRSIQILEYLDTPAARDYLWRLSEGIPEARLTRDAKLALARLTAKPPQTP